MAESRFNQTALAADSGYMFGESLEQTTTIGAGVKSTDNHFTGEGLKSFSDCILNRLDNGRHGIWSERTIPVGRREKEELEDEFEPGPTRWAIQALSRSKPRVKFSTGLFREADKAAL